MNDIEKKLEALKAEFLGKMEELQKEAEAQKEQEELKPWKPEAGEEYFFVDNDFLSHSFCNMNDEVDSYNFEIGNCFPTEERAEQVAKKMRLLLRLEQLHDMICPDYAPDYEDDEVKFYVYFDHSQGRYDISRSISWENPCMVAFDAEKNAQKAAEILNKELEESE
nr:MAG TPA: hypothetical protein [Caudoviricetes sp.]